MQYVNLKRKKNYQRKKNFGLIRGNRFGVNNLCNVFLYIFFRGYGSGKLVGNGLNWSEGVRAFITGSRLDSICSNLLTIFVF